MTRFQRPLCAGACPGTEQDEADTPWHTRTICIGASTSCWCTRRICSASCNNAGRRLFEAEFEVLLYDLTSTYFECDPPEAGKRRFGYSRDKRSDCVQVVIALIVTPDGLPLAYEVMPGNTSDKTTLRDFLKRIEAQYGKAGRTWVMDRGIPTEAVLAEMRASETPMHYLVGTPRGRLSQLEQDFLAKPWAQVRDAVQVKLVEQDGELYILARSGARRDKEQAMRRRRLKKLVKRLHELRQQKLTRDQLLIKLGAARKEAGPAAWRIIDIQLPDKDQPVTPETFGFKLNPDYALPSVTKRLAADQGFL